MFVPVGAYLICVNFWFIKSVLAPIAKMTDFAGKIAEGSYGIQSDEPTDNEIGVLTSEINSMSEKIAESDKTRTDFVSQVSHELRTPLTAITGWSETIAFDPTLDEDSRKGMHAGPELKNIPFKDFLDFFQKNVCSSCHDDCI